MGRPTILTCAVTGNIAKRDSRDDAHHSRDPGFFLLGAAQLLRLAVPKAPARYRFDIVIGGANSSWFQDAGD